MMPYVSTGSLPAPDVVAGLVAEAHRQYGGVLSGEVSDVYPALSEVPPDLFGVCVVSTGGHAWAAGDAEVEFTVMSVAKPFVFALACDALGPERAQETVGVDATGLQFNSLTAVERGGGRTNPMVNAGAIAARPATSRAAGYRSPTACPRSRGEPSGSTTVSMRRRPRPISATRRSRGCYTATAGSVG